MIMIKRPFYKGSSGIGGGSGGGKGTSNLNPLPQSEQKDLYMRTAPSQDMINYLEKEGNKSELEKISKYAVYESNLDLPELSGSEKQIAWADDIRKTAISNQISYLISKSGGTKTDSKSIEQKDKLINVANERFGNVKTVSDVVNASLKNNPNGAYAKIKNIKSAKEIIDKRYEW